MLNDLALKQQYEFATDATRLAHLASILEQNEGSTDEAEQFGELLAKTLSRENGDDQTVLRAAVTVLRLHYSESAAQWLINELEIESCLQYWNAENTPKRRACMLFSMPVVYASFHTPGTSLLINRNFETLHRVLADTRVISADCGFRLLPRLFTYEELAQLSHHELLKATLSLADQVTNAPQDPPAWECRTPAGRPVGVSVDTAEFPYVQLRYLVGMAITRPKGLDDIFPELESDISAKVDIPKPFDVTPAGRFEDGTWWADPFSRLLDVCAHGVTPILEVAPPDAFHDALRLGTERMRAHNTRLHLTYDIEARALESKNVRSELIPLGDGFGKQVGLTLNLYAAAESEPFTSASWHTFAHEELDELQAKLELLLAEMGLHHVPITRTLYLQ